MDYENSTYDHTRKHEFSPPIFLCWNYQSYKEKKAPNQKNEQIHCYNNEKGWFWKKHWDWGFGLNDGYNAHLFADERFMADWEWQMEQAYNIFKEKPYRFNAYTRYCK
jgi:hypothetical protein